MANQETRIEFDEQDYSPELVETMKDYMAFKEEESPTSRRVTADQLPPDLKEAMGLDMFPEDIQNDIWTLAQKITDYALKLAEQSEQESPYGAPPSTFGKLASCFRQAPYGQIAQDAWKGGSTAASYGRLLPGPMGQAVRPFMRPAGALATFGGALAGYTIGCMQRPKFPR
jgi:hypothetical protein